MDQERQQQHLFATTSTHQQPQRMTSSSMSENQSLFHPTTHSSAHQMNDAAATHAQVKASAGQHDMSTSTRPPLTADEFSSSLACIASCSAARQALHHQQSSSSSDYSREANVVTTTMTEGTTSNGSSTNSNNSGSGEENREFQAPQKMPPHHSRRNKRDSYNGDDYGLSLRVADDRLQAHVAHSSNKTSKNHHAMVAAWSPPPDSQSSMSSSGNEGSSTSALLKAHRGPSYHAIKQTLQSSSLEKKTSKTSGQMSSKKKQMSETASSDSSGEPTYKRHHHHHYHHGSKRPSTSSGGGPNDSKTKKLKTISAAAAAASSINTTSMARKKQQRPLNGLGGDNLTPHAAPRYTATEAEEDENYGSNSSAGSETEAGYAGSASSNENVRHREGSNRSSTSSSNSDTPDFSSGTSPSNSPSVLSSNGDEDDDDDDSSEDDRQRHQSNQGGVSKAESPKPAQWPSHLRSMEDCKMPAKTLKPPLAPVVNNNSANLLATAQSMFAKTSRSPATATTATAGACKPVARRSSSLFSCVDATHSPSSMVKTEENSKPPILSLGSDLMAHVLTFLEPPDILRVLTMPLSKDWQATFAGQQELWRVLCLLEPFKARVEEDDFSSSSSSSSSSSCGDEVDENSDDGSLSSFSVTKGKAPPANVWKKSKGNSGSRALNVKRSPLIKTSEALTRHQSPKLGKLGKYRLLYTSFVRCMKYLARMKEDVTHGRPPSIADFGGLRPTAVITATRDTIGSNRSLQQFLAGARDVAESQQQQEQQQQEQANTSNTATNEEANEENSSTEEPDTSAVAQAATMPILSADDGSSSLQLRRKRKKDRQLKRRKKPKFGRSMLTDRLLGPAPSGEVNPENVALPWSCALYSIVNWMVAFADVEGIQVMCLKVLPYLLEDEQQRITAQRVGLTDVILRGMVLFPANVHLHTASFHTLVLLARPLGGREGMLFHSSMVNAAGIFSGGNSADGSSEGGEQGSMFSGGAQNDGKNGIAVMLDSMRRFEADEALQAMSCWSLVNIALAPVQKEVLVKLGGIEVTTNAMMRHPHNAEVQFRALFALINLVIPSVNAAEQQPAADEVSEGIAVELDEAVGQITNLVVLAMKNFCASEAILNRACLVLHNLSLTQGYHSTLLWTPNCYQMLEWCLANYRTDQVLQQSAAGTLHRLQVTLSNDENLRNRFAASIQAQQQLLLEAAHREALQIYEQQEQLRHGQGVARGAARGGAE